MTVRRKLVLVLIGVVLAVTGPLSFFFFAKLADSQSRVEFLYTDTLLPMSAARGMGRALSTMEIALAEEVVGPSARSHLDEFVERHQAFRVALAKYVEEGSIASQPAVQRLLEKHGALQDQMAREQRALEELKRADPQITSAASRIFELVMAGKQRESVAHFNAIDPVFDRLAIALSVFPQLEREQGAYARRESMALLTTTRAQFWLIVGTSLTVSIITALVLTTMVLRPLRQLKVATEKIAGGDFAPAILVKSTDEFGQLARALGAMAGALGKSQGELRAHAQTLEVAVAERTAQLEQERASLARTVTERTSQLETLNAALVSQTRDLSRRNDEAVLFGRLDDFLQASASEVESYTVVANLADDLFHPYSGALYIFNSARSMLESVATWGEAPPASVVFPPNACWALRRGQAHLVAGQELRCAHVCEPDRMYVCDVLAAHGETLGIVHVLGPAQEDTEDGSELKEKYRLARNLAEHMGLAISNLKLRESMRNLAVRDGLTGLVSRRYMDDVLAQELARARRSGAQVAVLMLDVDHFRRFNDTFGQGAGDMVLRTLGRFLGAAVREGDVACRYGGEEFALILAGTTPDEAQQRAEEIRRGAKLLHLEDGGRSLGGITVSLGLAMFPDHGTDPETITRAADSALYEAKRGGRDQVVVFAGKSEKDAGDDHALVP